MPRQSLPLVALTIAAWLAGAPGCCPLASSGSSASPLPVAPLPPVAPPPSIVAPQSATPGAPVAMPAIAPPSIPTSSPLEPPMPPAPPMPPPSAPTASSGALGDIPLAPGLTRGREGQLECRWGTHALHGIALDLPVDSALWVGGNCNLTCSGCRIAGNDRVVEVGGTAQVRLIGSAVTARAGQALYLVGYSQVSVTASQVSGRQPALVSGGALLTTGSSSYEGGLRRSGNARITDEGGNTGIR